MRHGWHVAWVGILGLITNVSDAPAQQSPGASEKPRQELRAALKRDKILIGGKTYKQVFDAYVASSKPFFITSDSLLNAFHVLFEESVVQLERRNAAHLPAILAMAWNPLRENEARFKGDAALVRSARQRAQVTLGTAMRSKSNISRRTTFPCHPCQSGSHQPAVGKPGRLPHKSGTLIRISAE